MYMFMIYVYIYIYIDILECIMHWDIEPTWLGIFIVVFNYQMVYDYLYVEFPDCKEPGSTELVKFRKASFLFILQTWKYLEMY